MSRASRADPVHVPFFRRGEFLVNQSLQLRIAGPGLAEQAGFVTSLLCAAGGDRPAAVPFFFGALEPFVFVEQFFQFFFLVLAGMEQHIGFTAGV